MKYIKIFEEHNVGFQIVNMQDIPNFSDRLILNFSKSSFGVIENFIENINVPHKVSYGSNLQIGDPLPVSTAGRQQRPIAIFIYSQSRPNDPYSLILINPLKDEWFLIKISDPRKGNDYGYLCDQLDGLENCLNFLISHLKLS